MLAISLKFLLAGSNAVCITHSAHTGVCPCRPLAGIAGAADTLDGWSVPAREASAPPPWRKRSPHIAEVCELSAATYEFDLEGPQVSTYEGGGYSALLRAYALPPTLEQTVASLPFRWGASCPRGPCCMAWPVAVALLSCVRRVRGCLS